MGFDELVYGFIKVLLIMLGVMFVLLVVTAVGSRRGRELDDRDKKRLDDKPPASPPEPPKDGS